MKNLKPSNHAFLVLAIITAFIVIAVHPALAAGATSSGISVVPAELNITKAVATMNAAFEEGNWPRASAYAELITQNDENASADVWCRWAYSLRKMGQYEKALTAASAAVEKDPESVNAYLNRGYIYLALGEYQNARLDAEKGLLLDSANATAYNIIAYGLMGEGDPKNALTAVDTALAIRPDHVNYLNTKGMILIDMEKYSDAVSVLAKATELQDDYIAPYPDAIPPEENLKTAQKLYDENKAPVGLIIGAAVLILIIGAGAIILQKRK